MSGKDAITYQWAAEHLLIHCGSLQASERLFIVCCPETEGVAVILVEMAQRHTGNVEWGTIPSFHNHGQEPPSAVAAKMARANLVVGLTRHSMAHTNARPDASSQGARYLSLPDYSIDLLAHPSITTDYRAHVSCVQAMADAFTKGTRIEVFSRAGTAITLSVQGRMGNSCPGFVKEPRSLGSPPDIEANVSPVETESNGVIVVDGSIPIPGIGLMNEPLTLVIRDGAIVDIKGLVEIVSKLEVEFAGVDSEKTRVLAKCGVDFNTLAELTGIMLTDEGVAGTMHFGFGSNNTVGEKIDVPFHLDFVFRNPSLIIDEKFLIDRGQVLL